METEVEALWWYLEQIWGNILEGYYWQAELNTCVKNYADSCNEPSFGKLHKKKTPNRVRCWHLSHL